MTVKFQKLTVKFHLKKKKEKEEEEEEEFTGQLSIL
jgi:hypothetical protein